MLLLSGYDVIATTTTKKTNTEVIPVMEFSRKIDIRCTRKYYSFENAELFVERTNYALSL